MSTAEGRSGAGMGAPTGAPDPPALPLDIVDLVMDNTGYSINPDKWQKSQEERRQLEEQTLEIAQKLRAGGINPYHSNESVSKVGVCTGKSELLTPWRNSNLLPVVGSRNRRHLIAELGYYAQSHQYLRYMVVTSGTRCLLSELRDRLSALHRAVSKLAGSPLLKTAGVSVELRASEITVDEDKTFHAHANLVLNCSRKLGSAAWSGLLSRIQSFLGGNKILDSGRLKKPVEVVKYVLKPADIMRLDSTEVCGLFRQLERLHLVQPMGGFKAMLGRLQQKRLKVSKLRRVRNGVETFVWCEVLKQAKRCRSVSASELRDPDDVVLSVLRPAPVFTNRMEPCVLVKGYSGDIERMLGMNDLEWLLNAALAGC